MITLGLILLLIGYVLIIPTLVTIGWILLLIGLVLFLLGAVGRPVRSRPHWW